MCNRRGRFLVLCLSSLCVLCDGAVGSAHPVPKDNHDRTIAVWLTARGVEVQYVLDLDEGRAARDLAREELAGISTPEEFYRTFVRWLAPVLANNLDAGLDGKSLAFQCVERNATVKDGDQPLFHLRCTFRFEAPWEPTPGRAHAFTFREANYHDDDFSSLKIALKADTGVRLSAVLAPEQALQDRPAVERKPGDGERLRKLSANFTIDEIAYRGEARPARTPQAEPPRKRPRGRQVAGAAKLGSGAGAGESKPGPRAETAAGERKPGAPATGQRETKPGPRAETAAASSRPQNLLHLLLDTRRGLAMMLLMAVVLGAAHALTPGHGKTLVAAYLVGERGTVGHAVLLGVVTTVTHTAAVLLLAALLPVFFKDTPDADVQSALGMVGGLLVAGLGLWLLLRRLAGQADHVHLPGHGHHHHHHHHGHDHDHVPLPAGGKVGFWQLVVLGVQGGIVPCWDAIAMLCVAISAQRLWLGLPLLLAFSAGLAGVLILLGIGVVYTRDWAGNRWGDGPRARRLARALPLVSAAFITVMGLWLCYDSARVAAH
jgi:nickel/cobalt exporter